MRKTIICFISLLALFLASCTSNAGTTDIPSTITTDKAPTPPEQPLTNMTIYVISWSIGNISAVSYRSVMNGGEDMGCEIIIMGIPNETDFEAQNRLLQQAIDANADAIILAPVNFEAQAEAVSDAYRTGIPIVLVRESVNTEDYSAFIGFDEENVGRAAAMELIKKLRDSGLDEHEYSQVAVHVPSESAIAIRNRLRGFKEYWDEKAPDSWVVLWEDVKTNDGDYESAKEIVHTFLNDYPNLKGVFATSYFTTTFSAVAMMEAGCTDIALVGFGWSTEVDNIIREGFNASAICRNEYYLSYESVRLAFELANNGELDEKVIDAGVIVINAENIDSDEVQSIAHW